MTRHIGFLLTPGFAMMAFAAAIEPLKAANNLSGEQHYRWTLYSADGEPVPSSNGIEVVPHKAAAAEVNLDRLFVCGGAISQLHTEPHVLRWLRREAGRGTTLGALSTGSYLLAEAGLLDGYRCTLHWVSLAAFREAYPRVEATHAVYEIDRERITCAGGTSAMDLMLHLIGEDCGHELVTDICTWFMHTRMRTPQDQQGMAERLSLSRKSPRLAAAVNLMASNLEFPLRPREIADGTELSLRQLERLFKRYMSCTPQRYYLEMRLQHARRLLLETSLPVLQVSIASGFATQSHFSKCYREYYGKTPKNERQAQRERGGGQPQDSDVLAGSHYIG